MCDHCEICDLKENLENLTICTHCFDIMSVKIIHLILENPALKKILYDKVRGENGN